MKLAITDHEQFLLTTALLAQVEVSIEGVKGIRALNGDGSRPSAETISSVRFKRRRGEDKLDLARRVAPDHWIFLIEARKEQLANACADALKDKGH
jgi:hypothetical protein